MVLHIMPSRRFEEGECMRRTGVKVGPTLNQLMGQKASGRRLSTVGIGRIGQVLTKRAQGFGLTIH